jgi:hypothetical protein
VLKIQRFVSEVTNFYFEPKFFKGNRIENREMQVWNCMIVRKVHRTTNSTRNVAPMLRRSGVGPLVVRTCSSSSSNEHARTSRAARCKTMPRHEYAKPLITKDQKHHRASSLAFSRVSSTTTGIAEMTGKQEQKSMYPTLAFECVSSVQRQSNFYELRVSPVESRLKRGSSITTCVMDVLRAPSMIHSTPSMGMLEDFQKLDVQTDATDNMPPLFHRTTSAEIHEDCEKLKVQGSQTLDPGLFNPRSALFLFQDIEMHD